MMSRARAAGLAPPCESPGSQATATSGCERRRFRATAGPWFVHRIGFTAQSLSLRQVPAHSTHRARPSKRRSALRNRVTHDSEIDLLQHETAPSRKTGHCSRISRASGHISPTAPSRMLRIEFLRTVHGFCPRDTHAPGAGVFDIATDRSDQRKRMITEDSAPSFGPLQQTGRALTFTCTRGDRDQDFARRCGRLESQGSQKGDLTDAASLVLRDGPGPVPHLVDAGATGNLYRFLDRRQKIRLFVPPLLERETYSLITRRLRLASIRDADERLSKS